MGPLERQSAVVATHDSGCRASQAQGTVRGRAALFGPGQLADARNGRHVRDRRAKLVDRHYQQRSQAEITSKQRDSRV